MSRSGLYGLVVVLALALIGVGVYAYQQSQRPGLEAELEDLFVVDPARGRGIGRQLAEFAVTRAGLRGCKSIGLTTNERNAAALGLYERLGFTAERARWQGGRQLWLQRDLRPAAAPE